MLSEQEIHTILATALEQTQAGSPTQYEYTPQLVILGSNGILDSLDTMIFLDKVDDFLTEKTGKNIIVYKDEAFERTENPYQTMQTLAEYITELIADLNIV